MYFFEYTSFSMFAGGEMCIEYGYSSVCESIIKGDTPTLDIFFVCWLSHCLNKHIFVDV